LNIYLSFNDIALNEKQINNHKLLNARSINVAYKPYLINMPHFNTLPRLIYTTIS